MTTADASAYPNPMDPFGDDPAVQVDTSLPMWREGFALAELISLRLSPVYYGCGVPRGAGEPVILVPGFLGSDSYLGELFWWLVRIGYQPHYSSIVFNVDCPDATADDLAHRIRRVRDDTGQPVRIIGHSLGGLLASSVARRDPASVAGVIAMGAPIGEVAVVSPFIRAATESLRGMGGIGRASRLGPSCFSGFCTCPFVAHAMSSEGLPVPRYAIYSRTDGVVSWTSCLDGDPDRNREVPGTHGGLAWNRHAYAAVAECLDRITAENERPAGG